MLIVHYPTFGHEIMMSLLSNLVVEDSKGSLMFSPDSNVFLGGSTDVKLCDGTKNPDCSMYEVNPGSISLAEAFPTVVWEVAYGEDERKLAQDLGRWVACSRGRVHLAIGIKIERNRTPGGLRGLKKVTCALWEADYAEGFPTLEASGSPLDHLTRCDKYAEIADAYVVPPATKFSCVSELDGEYVKFVVSRQVLYTVGAFPPDYPLTL
jgi:hypothetical protein